LSTLDGAALELRKEKGSILPKLLKAWEAVTSFLHRCKCPIKLSNDLLQYLRMDSFKSVILFLCYCQSFFLSVIARIRGISRNDVFGLQRASICLTLPRIYSVFTLLQGIVKNPTARLKPAQHLLLLLKVWVDSVSVVHYEHKFTLTNLGNVALLPKYVPCGHAPYIPTLTASFHSQYKVGLTEVS